MFGFQQSTGDVIIFLDADDLLEPEVMQEVARVWRPGVSKVQFRMNIITSAGIQLGTAIPPCPPSETPEAPLSTFLPPGLYATRDRALFASYIRQGVFSFLYHYVGRRL
jgi:glycosyltransferase involved in cell wall biosynthesis